MLLAHFLVIGLLLYSIGPLRPKPALAPAMVLVRLPESPRAITMPPSALRSWRAPPIASSPKLDSPAFSIQPRAAPQPSAEPAPPAPAGGQMGDLFSPAQKEQFRRFFREQAKSDAIENARPAHDRAACGSDRVPEDGLTTNPANGISKNFVPGFQIAKSLGDSGDHDVKFTPCN